MQILLAQGKAEEALKACDAIENPSVVTKNTRVQILLAQGKAEEALKLGRDMGWLSDKLGVSISGDTLVLNLHVNAVFTESHFNELIRAKCVNPFHVSGVSRELATALIGEALSKKKSENIRMFEVVVGQRGDQILKETSLNHMKEKFSEYERSRSSNPGVLKFKVPNTQGKSDNPVRDAVRELTSLASDEAKIAYYQEPHYTTIFATTRSKGFSN